VEGLREKWSGESYLIFNQNRGAAKKGMREIRATALTEMGEVWWGWQLCLGWGRRKWNGRALCCWLENEKKMWEPCGWVLRWGFPFPREGAAAWRRWSFRVRFRVWVLFVLPPKCVKFPPFLCVL
jgi:hypothetical protein